MNNLIKIKLCKCGCGEHVTQRRDGTWNDYIRYHYFRDKNPSHRNQYPRKGIKHTEKTKKKISDSHTGRKLSEEHKRKIGISGKGRMVTEKMRKNMSEKQLGKKNHNYGKKTSKETRKKISEGGKGLERTLETKRKISKAHKGKKLSEETKLKLSKTAIKRFKNKKNHPNWQGGISFEPYCIKFNEKLKTKIRNRDNNICQNPHCSKKMKENGDVHHIDYNKKNSNEHNLLTLCHSCHSKSNINREYWQEFYEKIIILKYKK